MTEQQETQLKQIGEKNQTVREITKYLSAAQGLYVHDGDKIPKDARDILEKILGCRTHGEHNCMEGFCGHFKRKTRKSY